MKHVLRVINVLATVVILVAFVVLLRTVFTPAGEIPTIMGYGFMRTLTGSMEPVIPVHSFIVVDIDNSQAYQVGDIITFHSSDDALEGSLNTHRIVAVEVAADGTPVYRTKGDANPVEDAAPVPAAVEQIREKRRREREGRDDSGDEGSADGCADSDADSDAPDDSDHSA